MGWEVSKLSRCFTSKDSCESTMSDLIPPNTIVCKIIEGGNCGDNDFVEFETKINGRAFVFHSRAADDNDPKKRTGINWSERRGTRRGPGRSSRSDDMEAQDGAEDQ